MNISDSEKYLPAKDTKAQPNTSRRGTPDFPTHDKNLDNKSTTVQTF